MKHKGKKMDSVSFIKDKSEEGANWSIMRQVMINRSFYAGQQWISYDKINKRVFVPELRPGEKRYTYNKIKPAVKTLLSKTCKNRVKLEVKPDTNDIDRAEVAKAGIKYLKYQWGEDDMDNKSRRLKFHMIVDGFPALKVYVDKTKGQDIDTGEVTDDIYGEMKEIPTKTGKIITQVVDQYALKVDPSAESIEEIKWAMEERPTDVDEIEETWGVEVTTEDNIHVNKSFDVNLSTEQQKKYKNHAVVYDYWEFPCPKYPDGRRIVVAGDKELLKTDNPGENPFIFFPCDPMPGTAIASGIVTDMTTPQRSYNIKRTAEARILEEMGNPIWMTASSNNDDELVNEIGAIVHYDAPEMKPERVTGVEPGAGWQNAMERDEADLEDISGAHEISQGATPKGNNTLGGLQLQVEQDETKLAILVQSYEDGIKKWGEKVLRLVQKHFPEEQQLSIVGENGEIEAFTFSGADLTGSEVVDVVPGSSMPTLKVAQDEKVMAMYQAGMFNDSQTGQPDTRRVVRMLGESIATQYFDDNEQDENNALMENRQWNKAFEDPQTQQMLMMYTQAMQQFQMQAEQMAMQGVDVAQLGVQPPQMPVNFRPVRQFDNHEVHIAAHNRMRKMRSYDELPPFLQQIIDQHVQEHEMMLQAPMMEAQQQQMQAEQSAMQVQQQSADSQMNHEMEMKESDRQFQQESKMQDHEMNMQREALKGNIALKQAEMKNTGR